MKFPLPPIACTAALLGLALACPSPAAAGPLKSLGAGLNKLNPFKKTEPKPAEPPAPVAKPKAKPTVTKASKPSPVKKKKPTVSTKKKSSAGSAAAATAAAKETKEDGQETQTPTLPGAGNEPGGTAPPDGTAPKTEADATPATPAEIPFGTPVMGRKGLVRSPYAEDQGMVDVTDLPAGAKVKCPFTGKIFRVP